MYIAKNVQNTMFNAID